MLMFTGCFINKEPRSCSNISLSNTIRLVGFDTLKVENIKVYKLKNKKKPIFINNLIHYRDSSYYYGDIEIVLTENLFSKESYILLINNTYYNLTDFEVQSKLIMKGIKKDSICSLVSFKLNGTKNFPIYGDNQVQLKKI